HLAARKGDCVTSSWTIYQRDRQLTIVQKLFVLRSMPSFQISNPAKMLLRYQLESITSRVTSSSMKLFKSKLTAPIVSVRTYEMMGRPCCDPIQKFQVSPAMPTDPELVLVLLIGCASVGLCSQTIK